MGNNCCVNNNASQLVQVEELSARPVLAHAEEQELEAKPEPVAVPIRVEEETIPKVLPMVFDVQGKQQTVYIKAKPIGFTFDQKLPIKVTNVVPGAQANRVGIQVGWVLKSFDRDDFTKLTSFEDAKSLMEKNCESLPIYNPSKM